MNAKNRILSSLFVAMIVLALLPGVSFAQGMPTPPSGVCVPQPPIFMYGLAFDELDGAVIDDDIEMWHIAAFVDGQDVVHTPYKMRAAVPEVPCVAYSETMGGYAYFALLPIDDCETPVIDGLVQGVSNVIEVRYRGQVLGQEGWYGRDSLQLDLTEPDITRLLWGLANALNEGDFVEAWLVEEKGQSITPQRIDRPTADHRGVYWEAGLCGSGYSCPNKLYLLLLDHEFAGEGENVIEVRHDGAVWGRTSWTANDVSVRLDLTPPQPIVLGAVSGVDAKAGTKFLRRMPPILVTSTR